MTVTRFLQKNKTVQQKLTIRPTIRLIFLSVFCLQQ
jgi:hypothetical protein